MLIVKLQQKYRMIDKRNEILSAGKNIFEINDNLFLFDFAGDAAIINIFKLNSSVKCSYNFNIKGN
jgi:hypothetical protein